MCVRSQQYGQSPPCQTHHDVDPNAASTLHSTPAQFVGIYASSTVVDEPSSLFLHSKTGAGSFSGKPYPQTSTSSSFHQTTSSSSRHSIHNNKHTRCRRNINAPNTLTLTTISRQCSNHLADGNLQGGVPAPKC